MSTVKANTYQDASGGNTATINSMTPTADSLQGFRNRIINGAMVIDQRNAGASSASNLYTMDRWFADAAISGKYTVQQNSGSVTPPAGFTNYLGVVSSSAYTLLTGSYYTLQQYIEGFNVADLGWGTANAKTVTLSFWVRSSLTGTFGGALKNSAENRSYPFTYTISAANTWEQKSVTIAGDTSGTWLTNNGKGIALFFGLGVGSTYSGTAGAWAGANYASATGAVSVVSTNAATWYITGVQLEVGSTATPFERRPYGTELMLCQRYYEKSEFAVATARVSSTSTVPFAWTFKVIKRGAATVTVTYLSGNRVGLGPVTFSNTISSAYDGTDKNSAITWEATGDSTNNGAYNTIWSGTASAEL